jgi:hypothetical protein
MFSSQLFRFYGCFLIVHLLASLAVSNDALICEKDRPTFNKATRDPRPDILPYWLTNLHQDYRRLYNRPTYLGGKIAHMIEPSSQEAMVWAEAKQLGLYHPHHQPPLCRKYYAPKPWQRLATGPRPDKRPIGQSSVPIPAEEVTIGEELETETSNRIYYTEEFLLDDE